MTGKQKPPERVIERCKCAIEREDGTIEVSDEPIKQFSQNVDWDNLSPFEEYIIAVMEENDLLE